MRSSPPPPHPSLSLSLALTDSLFLPPGNTMALVFSMVFQTTSPSLETSPKAAQNVEVNRSALVMQKERDTCS